MADGKEIELAILYPTPAILNDAQKVYLKAFREFVDAGAIVRANLPQIMKDRKIWSDEMQEEYEGLQQKIIDSEMQLAKGGIRLTEAKKLAISIRKYRFRMRSLIAPRNELDGNTAEAQAENHKFNHLVSVCAVYNNTEDGHKAGEKVFNNVNEYLEHGSTRMAIDLASKLASMLYGVDSKFEHNLPENKFLMQYNFVDDNLRLVDKEGNFVDEHGHRIDEYGRYLDKDGNYVDRDGNRVDEKGNFIVEFTPFLDDDDNEVHLEEKQETDEVEELTESVE